MSDAVPFPSVPCPYCRQPCACSTDYIGTSGQLTQTGPYVCRACGVTEGGWDEDYDGAIFDRSTGWLMPMTPPSTKCVT